MEALTQSPRIRSRSSVARTSGVIYSSPLTFGDALTRLAAGQRLAVSVETICPALGQGSVRLLGISNEKLPEPILFDLTRIGEEDLEEIHRLLHGPQVKVAYDWYEVGQRLLASNLSVGGQLFDIRLAAQLLKAGAENYKPELPALAGALLGTDPARLERVYSWSGPLVLDQFRRARQRVAALLSLRERLVELLREHDLVEVAKLEFDCLPAMIQMGYFGIRLDGPRLEGIQQQLLQRAKECREKLLPWLPREVNVDSPKQVKEAFAKQGIIVQSVNREALLALRGHRELVEILLGYREAGTQEKTIVRKCLAAINPETLRVYPTWNQLGAATGRLSCSDPPLQGTPKKVEFRSCFLPEEGYLFVIGDLSQIELRVAAVISGDVRMIRAFREGRDLHRLTASLVTGKPLIEVTDEERQAAKALNFGLLFGMGEAGLQTYARTKYRVELTLAQARKFRERFFQAYPGLASWVEEQVANQTRETRTLSGRRRRWSRDQVPATELINAPIQGTAADILKKALGALPEVLSDYAAQIVACIHDEIIVEVEAEKAQEVAAILKKTMEQAGGWFLGKVPTVAEVRVASSWGEK